MCLAFLSCQQSNPKSEELDESAIKDAIEKVFLEWSNQFETLSVEGIMEYMADDDEIIWATDGSITKGRDAITEWMQAAISPIEKWHYTKYGEATIHVTGSNGAVHTVDFEESMTLSSGDTIVVKGVWTNVFQRSNGKWKVIHSASSHLAE
jgi:ketosteroid isomerase-like protein